MPLFTKSGGLAARITRRSTLALLVAAATVAIQGPAVAADKIRITRSTDSFVFATFLAADAGGFFEQQGIELEQVRLPATTTAVTAILGNEVDMFVGTYAPLLRARSRGANVTVVSTLTSQFVTDIVVSKAFAKTHGFDESTPLKERIEKIKGATIGIAGASGGGSDQIVRYSTRYAGLDADRDIVLTNMGNDSANLLAAFQAGRIDGFAIAAPASLQAVTNFDGMYLVKPSAGEFEPLAGYPYIVAAVSDDFLKSKPDLIERTLRAFQGAFNAYRDPMQTEQLRDAVHDKFYANVDKALFDKMWTDNLRAVPESVRVTPEQLQKVIDFENKLAKEPVDPAAVEGLFSPEIADKVAADLAVAK